MLNYSLDSLADVLKWMMAQVQVTRIPVPATEPWWIRQAHEDGLIEFLDDSKPVVLRAGYYLGECFVRNEPALRWTIGAPEFAEKNMPAVAGFPGKHEMAPVMVCENVFSRILGDRAPDTHINTMIQTWLSFVS